MSAATEVLVKAVAPKASAPTPQKVWAARAAGYATALGFWWVLSTYVVNPVTLPPPQAVLGRMVELAAGGQLVTHFTATLTTATISLALLFVLGAGIGILMGVNAWFEAAFRNWLTMMMSIPGILVVLIVLLVMGLNPVGPIVAVVLTNFAFVTVNVWEGVSAIPTELTDMARAFGVSRRRILTGVVVPALAPFLFTALTYAFALSWKITMLAELFGSTKGMGYMFRLSFNLFSVTSLLAWALWSFVLFMFLERGVLHRMELRFFRWRTESYR